MKDQVNVLFVCGYGLGSSAVAEMLVKKGLVAEGGGKTYCRRRTEFPERLGGCGGNFQKAGGRSDL